MNGRYKRKNKAATHELLAASGLWRAVSFNTALFMHSPVPLWLLYLSSVLWLLHRPPQLLSPARAYVTQRQIWIQLVQSLSRSTLYSACCHRGPLSDILARCLLSSESPGWPVQLWRTVIPSPVQHKSFSLPWPSCREGILTGRNELIHDILQPNDTAQQEKPTFVTFAMFCWNCKGGEFKLHDFLKE